VGPVAPDAYDAVNTFALNADDAVATNFANDAILAVVGVPNGKN
jgi:hypothetical protein